MEVLDLTNENDYKKYNTLDKSVQKHLDETTAKADELCDKKVAEIMEV